MDLLYIIQDFKNGNNEYDGTQLIVKVKENESYETYYTISFSSNDEYRDIFLSSGIVYKDDCMTMYECADGHEDDYTSDIKNGLYEKLNKLKVVNILDEGIDYDYLSGCHDYESLNVEDIELH